VALRIDREALDTALGDFAATLEKAEMQIAALWAWWTGESLEYTVGYPRDFVLQDEKTMLQPLLDTFTTLAQTMPEPLRAGILERIGGILLEDDDERMDALRESLDQASIDATQAPATDNTQVTA
jgi:hypothetical protein